MDSGISFDEQYNLRVFEPQKFKETEQLRDVSQQFTEKLTQFKDIVKSVTSISESQASRIEKEKLRAVGMRNKVEGELEVRKRRQREVQSLIAERQAELDRYIAEYESLAKVEQEQKRLIEKLSSDQPPV